MQTLSRPGASVEPRPAGVSPTSRYRAWVAKAAKQPLVFENFDPGPLAAENVEIEVEHCGLCRSDLSVLNDEWGVSQYPAVLGHEVVGRVTALGAAAKALPAGLIIADAGPLLCGGVTVFAPLRNHATPASRVGVIGIGGLGHLAVKFAAAYGCEVTAFTSTEGKFDEARGFGARHVVSSRDPVAIGRLAGTFDLLISTVNVGLDWNAIIAALAPGGRLHLVGVVPEPIPVPAASVMLQQLAVSGSPTPVRRRTSQRCSTSPRGTASRRRPSTTR